MDYEKKYKEALERAKEIIECSKSDTKEVRMVLSFFPELRENKNEKVKKSLIRLVKSFYDVNFPTPEGFTKEQLLSWLEKQGDQKPAAWSKEDEKMIEAALQLAHEYGRHGLWCWLKSLRPHNWTKEDKERYISCLQRLGTGNPEQPETINSKWFKEHVYSQNRWKPSDEQIVALEKTLKYFQMFTAFGETIDRLKELEEQLKKLREE